MFTGIVELIGVVSQFEQLDVTESGGNGISLTIKDATEILGDCHLGDSIAVNGVCLTVTEFDSNTFKVGVAPETLRRSNLGQLKTNDRVNLERAVSGEVRFGGHFVQGHVDTTGEIIALQPDENALTVTVKVKEPSLMKYIVEKGFITLDGTSLTVTAVDDDLATFSIMLIAYTQQKVIIASKHVGDTINIEVDVMGKLVEKQLQPVLQKIVNTSLQSLVDRAVEAKLSR